MVYTNNMKIALVGWGLETKSVYRYYGEEHEYLIASEEPRDDFPSGDNITIQSIDAQRKPGLTANVDDLSYLKGVEQCDIIVLTPTAKKTFEKYTTNNAIDSSVWGKTTSNLQLFFENCSTKNIIGVTGTKGKGTTSTLIAQMIEASGKKVHLGGNIGIPALDLLPDISKDDWVVLELSSFQLYKFSYSPHIAVHLMMLREHIDEWHITMADYVQAKANVFANQASHDIAIYYPQNKLSTKNSQLSRGLRIPYMKAPGAIVADGQVRIGDQNVIDVHDIALKGDHNLQNICAAVTAAWQVHQNVDAISKVLKKFTGLEHRLQFVREYKQVKYYDDSFGTTPDTAIVAMDAFEQPKIMIVGGHDKGNNMQPMIDRLQRSDIHGIIGVGQIGYNIVSTLSKTKTPALLHTKTDYNDWTMREIVKLASQSAKPGDIVLLSAGTSSFGIFNDYKDRGNQFIEVVTGL